MLDYEHARHRMVEAHIARRGVRDERVLRTLRRVPREAFVDEGFEEFAYEDSPLPIGSGQTISQPFIVARMAEAAEVERTDRVLEIGTGSGYAAAVLAELAAEVYTIERHRELAGQAARRLHALGYHNVFLDVRDGTKGWPEKAPFDVILVAAGGPSVPVSLQEQLEIGGRLVIPVGNRRGEQRLLRVTRVSANKYEEEDLGGVMFVPLIGEEGWNDEAGQRQSRPARQSVPELIAEAAEDLPPIGDPAFEAMFDRFGERRVVLLGEASHGTSEFYRARSAITKRLVEKHGFTIVALEADWPDAAYLNRLVRGERHPPGMPLPFQRFPTWMWRNTDVAAFLDWLRRHNTHIVDGDRKVGLYGLDLYNMSGSIAAVLAYLDKADPEAATVARERYGCLTPWQNEPATYGRAVLRSGYKACEEAVVKQCRELLERSLSREGSDLLDAQQNAKLIASAEKYYRVMYYGGAETWNLRDRHMFETLERLLEDARGSKAVVWAHNSHVGDARNTDMGTIRHELNIGQLCRERFGDQAALIGFGTHSGKVACASDWNGPTEIKEVRPSLQGSIERLCHDSGKRSFLLDFEKNKTIAEVLKGPLPMRYIGVIYRPETERLSHYMESSVSRQFDAFLWFDRTSPVEPVAVDEGSPVAVPDTFPFGT